MEISCERHCGPLSPAARVHRTVRSGWLLSAVIINSPTVTSWRAAVPVDYGSLSNGVFMWAKAICKLIYTKRKRR